MLNALGPDMCASHSQRSRRIYFVPSSDFSFRHLLAPSRPHLQQQDYLRAGKSGFPEFDPYKDLTVEESYSNTGLLKAQVALSKQLYQTMVQPSELLTSAYPTAAILHPLCGAAVRPYPALDPSRSPSLFLPPLLDRTFSLFLILALTLLRFLFPRAEECGNSYCGSLYAGLLSLVSNRAEQLPGSRVLMFSYGSGLAATLFSLRVTGDVTYIRDAADVHARLATRSPVAPAVFEDVLAHREKT